MDIVTLGAALNGSKKYTDARIAPLLGGVHYRGSVNYVSNLPTDPEEGDAYTVKYKGTSGTDLDGAEYVWGLDTDDNTYKWIVFAGDSYTKAEVDALLSGKQGIIDSSHKLDADLVDDTNATHKFATAEELTQIAKNTGDINTINGFLENTKIESWNIADTGRLYENTYVTTEGVGITHYYEPYFTLTDIEIPAGATTLYFDCTALENQDAGAYSMFFLGSLEGFIPTGKSIAIPNNSTKLEITFPYVDGDYTNKTKGKYYVSFETPTGRYDTITIDGVSTNVVPKEVLDDDLADKQDALTFDSTPTSESTNPVTSGGVYTALGGKQDIISDLPTIRSNAAAGAEAATAVQQLDTDIHTYIGVDLQLENYYFWDVSAGIGETAVKRGNSAWKASRVISVSEGDTYKVIANQGVTHKARIWALCDNSMKIVSMSEDAYKDKMLSETFTVPTGATKLIVSHFFTGTSQGTPYLGRETLKSEKLDISGKKLSLLGDSISAFAGTLPQGNEAYYTGSNAGVADAYQMWWNILCDRTGLEPLVINAWSGSGITQLTDSGHSSKVPMSDTSRCQALHSGSTNPDIILIAGGVNDYTYAEQSSQTPSNWDGSVAPVSGNSFDETYAVMIKNIQAAYPNAIVVCLSTFFTMRGTDNGYTLVNGEGLTQADYDKAIEKVARLMRVPYISVDTCGFSRSNYYPTYAQDSSTIPTHPNEAGQKVIGEYISDVLPTIIKAFVKGD